MKNDETVFCFERPGAFEELMLSELKRTANETKATRQR